MRIAESLLAQILAYCESHKMAHSTFGLCVANTSKLVERLRAGKGVNLATADRIIAFMDGTGTPWVRGMPRGRPVPLVDEVTRTAQAAARAAERAALVRELAAKAADRAEDAADRAEVAAKKAARAAAKAAPEPAAEISPEPEQPNAPQPRRRKAA